MEIIAYRPRDLLALTVLYNELVRDIPTCYPIEPAELAAAFAGACGYEARGEQLIDEAVFVAVDGEGIGFIHVGEGRTSREEDAEPQGIIRFLAYPRGRRAAGQALLERGETWLQMRGLSSVLIYRQAYRYPFYHFSHAYLSNRLEHIQALLLFNGYQVCGGEVFLNWPEMAPTPPRELDGLNLDVVLEPQAGHGRLPDLSLKAYHAGEEIGECYSISARAFAAQEVLDEWIFTTWLGVAEPYQGRGLGHYLLGRSLVEAQRIGYRHAAISTALRNHRALLFYANFGYRAVDWTRQLRRDF